MSHPNKARGTKAETDLLKWLHQNGREDAVRNPPAGSRDVGDLTCWTLVDDLDGCVGDQKPARVVIEVKSYKDQTAAINQGLAELDAEMVNAGTSHGVLVVKRRGKGDPGEWLAVRKVKNDPEIGGL